MAAAAAAPAAAAPVAAVAAAAAAPAAAAVTPPPAAAAGAIAAAATGASGGNPDPHVRSPLSAHSNAPSSSAMSAGVTSADRAVDAFFGRALFARAASEGGGDVSHLAPCLDDRQPTPGRSPGGGREDHLSLPGTPSGATSVQGSLATHDGISAPLPGEVNSGATGGSGPAGAAAAATPAGATPPRQMMPAQPQQQPQAQQQQQQQQQQHVVAEADSLSLDIPLLLTTSAPPPAALRVYALFRHASYHMLAVVAVLLAFVACTATPAFLLAPNPHLLAADARAAETAATAASVTEAALPAGVPSEAFARSVRWHSRREEWAGAAPPGEPSRVVAVTVLRATAAEAAGPMACGVFTCWYYDAPRGVFESVSVADVPEDEDAGAAAAAAQQPRRHSHTLSAKAKKLLRFAGVSAIVGAAAAGAVLLKMILNVLLLAPEETESDAAFGEEDGGAGGGAPAAAAAAANGGGSSAKAVPDIIVVVNGGATEPVQPDKQPPSPPPSPQRRQPPPAGTPQRSLWRRAARRVFGRGREPGVRTRALALLAVVAVVCVALMRAGVSAAADGGGGSPPAPPRTPFDNGGAPSSGSVETVLQGAAGAFMYTWTNSTVREAGPGTRVVGRNATFVSRSGADGSGGDAARVLPSVLVFYMPLAFLALLLLSRACAGLLRRACAPQLRRFAEGGTAAAVSVAAPTLPDLPPACGRASCGDRCCCRVDQLLFATCIVPTDPVAAFAAARGGKALGAGAGAGAARAGGPADGSS
eukprot:Rhum_TRINITY_DN14638_c18_g5::Rhum_TRINITY_DN14638_c18_g5_i1::g.105629::m.105629